MIVVIEGVNRIEFCKPAKKADVDNKFFFETRHQLYRVFPEQLTRVDVYRQGVYVGSDEMIVYPENNITPQLIRGTEVDFEKLMMDIDEAKSLPEGFFKTNPQGKLTSGLKKAYDQLYKYLPMLIVGAVLLYAYIAGR